MFFAVSILIVTLSFAASPAARPCPAKVTTARRENGLPHFPHATRQRLTGAGTRLAVPTIHCRIFQRGKRGAGSRPTTTTLGGCYRSIECNIAQFRQFSNLPADLFRKKLHPPGAPNSLSPVSPSGKRPPERPPEPAKAAPRRVRRKAHTGGKASDNG